MKDPFSVPKTMQEPYDAITALTDGFCRARLCRERPSPLTSGRANSWAAGIVHAIGTVNFAFDKTQIPHTTIPDISDHFGVAKSSPARAMCLSTN